MTRLRKCESGRGSVAMYVVVGIVLVAALVSGIYVSKHGISGLYNDHDRSVKVADDSSAGTDHKDTTKPSGDLKNQTNQNNTNQKQSADNQQSTKNSAEANLPATGAGATEIIAESILLASVVYIASYYLRGRDQL